MTEDMYPGEFERLHRRISELFTLDSIAERCEPSGKIVRRHHTTPIWEVMDDLYECDFIDVGDGRHVSCQFFFKKTVRILFYVVLVEVEGRLFRIHEWNGKSLDELNERNINELIKELLDSDLISYQHEYEKRSGFKEDLKAVSSFRNVIMHVNKKLEKTLDLKTLVKRKKQILKVLSALQQILDQMGPNRTIKK